MYRWVTGGFGRPAHLGLPKNFRGEFGLKNLLKPFSHRQLWLTYACDLALNRLKWSGIAKWKISESFVKLALTIWEIWPPKTKLSKIQTFFKLEVPNFEWYFIITLRNFFCQETKWPSKKQNGHQNTNDIITQSIFKL